MATLSHTRPLSLRFLMTIPKKSVPTHQPITPLHLSIPASRSCWKDQERAQAQLQRDRPLTRLQPNDTPSPWRILLPSIIKDLAHFEERRLRSASVLVSLLILHHLCLQNPSAVWVGNPNLPRNLLLNSKNKQSSCLQPAAREMHLASLQQQARRQL